MLNIIQNEEIYFDANGEVIAQILPNNEPINLALEIGPQPVSNFNRTQVTRENGERKKKKSPVNST
jgi:hypothetical protein